MPSWPRRRRRSGRGWPRATGPRAMPWLPKSSTRRRRIGRPRPRPAGAGPTGGTNGSRRRSPMARGGSISGSGQAAPQRRA
eukprot:4335152-Lingulodinium_polyedra.AAC.1